MRDLPLNKKQQKDGCIALTIMLVLFITAMVLLYFTIDRTPDQKISRLENELINVREKIANDSILIYEYQRAMGEMIHESPECAIKFSSILEKIDNE